MQFLFPSMLHIPLRWSDLRIKDLVDWAIAFQLLTGIINLWMQIMILGEDTPTAFQHRRPFPYFGVTNATDLQK